MIKALVGEATRRDAHNLDDHRERWEHRLGTVDPVFDLVSPEMPKFKTIKQVKEFAIILKANRTDIQTLLKQIKRDMYGRDTTNTKQYKSRRQHLTIQLEKNKDNQETIDKYLFGAMLATKGIQPSDEDTINKKRWSDKPTDNRQCNIPNNVVHWDVPDKAKNPLLRHGIVTLDDFLSHYNEGNFVDQIRNYGKVRHAIITKYLSDNSVIGSVASA